jgi:hypothetical protein
MISSRWKTRIVPAVCLLLILPWSLFFGVMFTFSFRSHESAWAWVFDFVTYWNQLLAAGFSFVRPRTAAFWTLADIACSAAIGLGFTIQSSSAPGAEHGSWLDLIQYGFRTALFFWGVPIVAALLLLITNRRNSTKPKSHS